MNTHDKINRLIDKIEAIPAMDFAARAKGFHDLRAAIEVDRQRRGEPVAYRLLRKNADGEWVTDGRPWCDGVPDAGLVKDSEKSGQYRIEYAFADPQPAEPVKKVSDEEFIREIIGASQFAPAEHYAGVEKRVRALLARYGHMSTNPENLCPSEKCVQKSAESIHEPTLEEEEAWQQMERRNE